MKKSRLIAYLAVIAVLIAAFALMGASCSVSTANVKNAVMTTAVDENYAPMDNVSSFPVNSIAYVTADLHNAPDDTVVTFKWFMGDQQVDEYVIGNEGNSEAAIACGTDQIIQPGDYRVEIYIDEREEPDAVAQFTVQ